MKITVTAPPHTITSFFFSPVSAVSDIKTRHYLEKMITFIFGRITCNTVQKLDLDIFDLVYINDKPFNDICSKYVNIVPQSDIIPIKTAVLMRKLYKGAYIRISEAYIKGDSAYISEPEYTYMSIIDASANNIVRNEKILRKSKKNSEKVIQLNNKALHVLETARIAAIKYSMSKVLEYKELLDKYNFRRFSTNLRMNNRPAELYEVNNALARRKMYTFADLSDTMTRLNFSALYAMTYGGFTFDELFNKETVFQYEHPESDPRLGDLSGNLIDIIINGNGIEIGSMFINMITTFTEIPLPEVNVGNLQMLMDNYSLYYAVASLAGVCENIFKLNEELKKYMKKQIIDNYWNYTKKLILMREYSSVVTLCNALAKVNVSAYRDDKSYEDEILFAFEKAEKFSKELKEYV